MGGVEQVCDVTTFEDYFSRERTAMLRVAYLITRSRPIAEEIVQDAFVAVYQRWTELDSPSAYLRTTVVRAAVATRNRSWRGRALEARSSARPAPEPGVDEMRTSLAHLPPKQRAALVLRFYCDLTHEDIAAALGCTAATARSLTHRGLAALRKDMNRWTIQ